MIPEEDFNLLQDAAKAVGGTYVSGTSRPLGQQDWDGAGGIKVNNIDRFPLDDAGHAFWLMVECGIQLEFDGNSVAVYPLNIIEKFDGDKIGATCRAIVRAAAALGKAQEHGG